MRASNDRLRDTAISSTVFENISNTACFLPLANTQRVSFLNYFISLWFGTVHSLVKWLFGPAGCPSMEIPLPLLEILAWDLQFQDNNKDLTAAIQLEYLFPNINSCLNCQINAVNSSETQETVKTQCISSL